MMFVYNFKGCACIGLHLHRAHGFEVLPSFWFMPAMHVFKPFGSVVFACMCLYRARFHAKAQKTLSFRTDRSGQTVQTQIRLLLEEQSDQGLHCLLFPLHHFDKIT